MWLPKGFNISKEMKIKKILESAENLEIYSTVFNDKILVITKNLYERLCKDSLIPGAMFSLLKYNEKEYFYLKCKNGFILSNIKNGYAICNKSEAINFINVFLKARKITDVSLFDAIYIEEFSLLLPTYSQDIADDKTAIGTFLSGGVIISIDNFERLADLVAFLSPSDLAEVIEKSGFDVLKNGMSLSRQKYVEDEKTGEIDKPTRKTGICSGKFKLIGRPQLETFFNEHIVDILQNEEKYKKMGIKFPSAVILHGPPGCGKTFAVDRLIEFLDLPFYEINSSSVASPFIHDTSKKVSEVFDKAIENAPSVIVIDEMEAYLTDRGVGASSGIHHVEEVAEFLRQIPEAINSRVLVIAMTNMIDMIDPAILRRGRFDHIIEVSMPSKEEVEMLLNSLFEKLPTAKDLDLSKIVDKLTGKPLSDSAFVAREAARIAAKSNIDEITNECIDNALKRLPKGRGAKKIGFRSADNEA